jgi:hypothetical protein
MRRIDLRNAILCAAAVLVAILITNPFAQVPFNDDWTYAFSVRHLLLTGKMTYHCGESAAFLTQAWWGVAWAKIFGFSFVSLRFSTLPWALGSVVLVYFLAREAGLHAPEALLATLLFGFSPLFLPLASSFMSDVPSEFCVLLAIYAFTRAARAESARRRVMLLFFAYVTAILGGLSRQIAWIIPVTTGPYVALLHRRELATVIISLLGIGASLLVAFISSRWFYAQPFVMVELPFPATIRLWRDYWQFAVILWLGLLLTTVLLILPAALPAAWASLLRTCADLRSSRAAIAVVLAILIVIITNRRPALLIEPWLGDIISSRGVLSGMELSGRRPIVQPLPLRQLLAMIVVIVSWIFLTACASALFGANPISRLAGWFRSFGNRIAIPAMLVFACAYLGLIAYRAPRNLIFDRYSLPLIPCFAIPLLSTFQGIQRHRLGSLAVAWVFLLAWAVYAIASTQEVHALQAARFAAASRLLGAGVPDTAIADGTELDSWTQMMRQGYINIPDINSPAGTYNPNLGSTPALRCAYRVEFNPAGNTEPSKFGYIDYSSWLPPFHRRIYIDRFTSPAWLDPARHAPPPKEYEDYYFH